MNLIQEKDEKSYQKWSKIMKYPIAISVDWGFNNSISLQRRWKAMERNPKCGRSKLLYSIGLNPTQMIFWVLYYAADVVRENPECILALRCQLYPEICKRTKITSASLDCMIRRLCSRVQTNEACAPLREYLPAGVERPTVSELLSAWLLMVLVHDQNDESDGSDIWRNCINHGDFPLSGLPGGGRFYLCQRLSAIL